MSLGTHRCERAAAQLLGCNFSLGFFSAIFLCILVFFVICGSESEIYFLPCGCLVCFSPSEGTLMSTQSFLQAIFKNMDIK